MTETRLVEMTREQRDAAARSEPGSPLRLLAVAWDAAPASGSLRAQAAQIRDLLAPAFEDEPDGGPDFACVERWAWQEAYQLAESLASGVASEPEMRTAASEETADAARTPCTQTKDTTLDLDLDEGDAHYAVDLASALAALQDAEARLREIAKLPMPYALPESDPNCIMDFAEYVNEVRRIARAQLAAAPAQPNATLRETIETHLKANGWTTDPIGGFWRHPERGFATTLAPQGAVAWQIEREERERATEAES